MPIILRLFISRSLSIQLKWLISLIFFEIRALVYVFYSSLEFILILSIYKSEYYNFMKNKLTDYYFEEVLLYRTSY